MKRFDKIIRDKYNTELILEYIDNRNLTKKEFCLQCKMSMSVFYNILNQMDVKLMSVFKIAKCMGVPIHMLFK